MPLVPNIPLPQETTQTQEGRTHTKFYWGEAEYLQRQVNEKGVTQVGEMVGTRQTRIQNDPCTHPNPRKGGGAAGAQEDGLGKDSKGPESLGWGAQGLVNIDHSQKGMGVGEGSPYTSSQG